MCECGGDSAVWLHSTGVVRGQGAGTHKEKHTQERTRKCCTYPLATYPLKSARNIFQQFSRDFPGVFLENPPNRPRKQPQPSPLLEFSEQVHSLPTRQIEIDSKPKDVRVNAKTISLTLWKVLGGAVLRVATQDHLSDTPCPSVRNKGSFGKGFFSGKSHF